MKQKTVTHFHPEAYYNFYSRFNIYNKKSIASLKALLEFDVTFILDLACGVGLSTMALQNSFTNAQIIGVDINCELITFAQKSLMKSNVKFECTEIKDILAKIPKGSVDIIFVKSAYHYFEHQVTLSHLKSVLSKHGTIVIMERTSRSARSYPLPKIIQSYWADYFAQPRELERFEAAKKPNLTLSISSYGEYITIPAPTYFEAIRENQIFGAWALKPSLLETWIESQIAKKVENFTVFEEYWFYIYRV